MREVIKSNFATVPFVVGASLFLCALIFYYFAVLRVDYTKTSLLDLGPHPDATEYFAQAKALGMDGWPSIQIGYEKLPSRYPPGHPLLMLLAFMFAYLGVTEERRSKIYLSAILLGLSVNVRLQSAFFAPLLLVMAIFPKRDMRMRWLLHCAAVAVVFVLAASPVLLLNTIQFHSPFRTGYDFWTPFFSKNHLFFSLRYIPNNAVAIWNEFALRPLDYHTANIFGTGTCFVPAFVFLTCAGLFFIRIDRFVTCAVLACSAFLGVILTHNYRLVDARYYLPLLILSIALAVLP